jgi:hypothetical protein
MDKCIKYLQRKYPKHEFSYHDTICGFQLTAIDKSYFEMMRKEMRKRGNKLAVKNHDSYFDAIIADNGMIIRGLNKNYTVPTRKDI